MKIRHFALLLITLLIIAFMQPVVLLVGGITLLGGVLALIFADLPPEKQDAWEMKLTQWVQQTTSGLRKQPRRETLLPVVDNPRIAKVIKPAPTVESTEHE